MAICVWGSALLVNKKYIIVKEVKICLIICNNYVQGHHTIAVNCNTVCTSFTLSKHHRYHTIWRSGGADDTLQKPASNITWQALRWNSQGKQGKRKRGRLTNSWRRDLDAECQAMGQSCVQLERTAQNRDAWQALVDGQRHRCYKRK
jgi:hypothetical protein